MIGGLLTVCGCNACDSTLPALPLGVTKLIKGVCATTELFYINRDGSGQCGPYPIKHVTLLGQIDCVNNLLVFQSATGPFPWTEYQQWKYAGPPEQEYFLEYDIKSTTKNRATWDLTTSSIQTTTGGYARQSTGQILVTGGIPIKRRVYQFSLLSATGSNNQPYFITDEYERIHTCCCGGPTEFDQDLLEYTPQPCDVELFGRVKSLTQDSEYIARNISNTDLNQFQLNTINLFYPGKINNTHNVLTINLADNPTNNSKEWTAIVSSGTVTMQSSVGDVIGPFSGSINAIGASLAAQSSAFSSVILSPNLVYSGPNTIAQGTDLPDWSSTPVQRGVNGTSISIPIVFSNYDPAPSTYKCGFYDSQGNSFFGCDFASMAGYSENSTGYQQYLERKRYAKKSQFIENLPLRGLFYTREYDKWLGSAESGNTWSMTVGSSIHTRSYPIQKEPFTTESYTLRFSNCFRVDPENPGEYTPDYGSAECDDNTPTNGSDTFCPSNSYWTENVLNYFDERASPGRTDCYGKIVCINCLPEGPLQPPQWCCVCGIGNTFSSQWAPEISIATQTLSGEWYIG